MDEKWEYYVSTVIADESDRVKTAEKLEAMMKRQGVAGWELVCHLQKTFKLETKANRMCYFRSMVLYLKSFECFHETN